MNIEQLHIALKGLRFHASHGVLPQERLTGGDFVVDICVDYGQTLAVETDNVDDTLNYAALYHIIEEEMAQPSNLLEHVVGRIGKRIFREFVAVDAVDLTITKVNPPMGADCFGAAVKVRLIRD
ncbi:MAG: dihydroneopterin aldolase [Prevotella sp.]|nr:dihydroneopterin aldolase [Prevotella sp.]